MNRLLGVCLLVNLAYAADFPGILRQAEKAREAGRLDEAITLYRQGLKLDPKSGEALWYLGMCLYELDRHGEAEKVFAPLVAMLPNQGAGWAMLGLVQFRAGHHQPALANLRKAHSLGVPSTNDLDKVARYHLVILLNQAGEFEISSGLLMHFVASDTVTPLVQEAAGIAALRLTHLPGKAPPELSEAVALAGEASILAWRKRVPEARSKAARLMERYPKLANAHYLMGYLLLLEGDERAIEEFSKEIEISPTHVQARLQIAYEQFKRGRPELGLDPAKRAVELAPNDFIARNIYGRILLEMNKVTQAIVQLETAAKLAPSSPEAHFHLATAYNRAGRKQEAARHREIFTKLDKDRKP